MMSSSKEKEKATHTIDGYPNYLFTNKENIYRKSYIDSSGNFRVFKMIQKRKDGRFILFSSSGVSSCFSIEKIKQMGLLTKIGKHIDIDTLKGYSQIKKDNHVS